LNKLEISLFATLAGSSCFLPENGFFQKNPEKGEKLPVSGDIVKEIFRKSDSVTHVDIFAVGAGIV
jgi:hypothetical protein